MRLAFSWKVFWISFPGYLLVFGFVLWAMLGTEYDAPPDSFHIFTPILLVLTFPFLLYGWMGGNTMESTWLWGALGSMAIWAFFLAFLVPTVRRILSRYNGQGP